MKALDTRKFLIVGTLVLASTLMVYGVSPKDAAAVKEVAFQSQEQSLEVKITATEKAKFTYFELSQPRRLVIDFRGMQNKIGFDEKKVDAAGVKRIRTSLFTGPDRNATRVIFDLNTDAQYRVVDDGAGLVRVLFGDSGSNRAPANLVAGPAIIVNGVAAPMLAQVVAQPITLKAEPAALAEIPEPSLSLASALMAAQPLARTSLAQAQAPAAPPAPAQAQGQYTGELISLDLKEVDLKDFFRLIGDISGLNIVLDPNVSGSLTILLKDVPWDQALDVVLRNYQLGSQLQGNVLRIATNTTLANEENVRKALRDAQEMAAELSTRMYILNYTKSVDMAGMLQRVLTTRGTIIQDPRRNALIVTDIPAQFGKVDQMIKSLDVAAQQVEIEARLLSAQKSFSREIGVQLGFIFGANNGNILTGGVGQGSPFQRTPPPRATIQGGSSIPLAVNLPAPATSGLAFLSQPGGDVLLDAIITAAEAKGTAKLISRPRVTTQNNQPATVQQGTKIPVQTNVNNTISVQFLDFALKLVVTPQITEAGTILLTVDVENSQPDFARAVNSIPSVATQQATTQVLIPDGGTAVIGGILIDQDSLNIRQVPGLGSLPVIGHLFKNTQTLKSTSELFFFVTPRIKPPDSIQVAVPGD